MAAPQSGRGFNQYELWDVFNYLRTRILGATAKLDADSAVNSTNYTSTTTFTFDRKFARVAVRDQSQWLLAMDQLRTALNNILTKLDVDSGVSDTDYSSTLAIADYTNVRSSADLLDAGMRDGAVAKWLDTFITKFNSMLTKLDADGTVNDTNYNSLWAVSTSGSAAKVDASRARLKVA